MKRILSFVIAAMMVVMMLPAVVSAAAVEVDTAEKLAEAVANGGEVKITADIEVSASVVVTKDVTIDLNGHKLSRTHTADGACIIRVDAGHAIITDSAATNGEGLVSVGGGVTVYVWETGKATLKDVNATGYHMGVTAYGNGELIIDDGAVVTAVMNTAECGDGIRAYENSKVTIKDGAKVIAVENSGTAVEIYGSADVTNCSGAELEGMYGVAVYGGTFNNEGDITAEETAILVSDEMTVDPEGYVGEAVIEITGGTVSGKNFFYSEKAAEDITITVEDGTFDGAIASSENAGIPEAFISGGTFSEEPAEEYLADNKKFDTDNGMVICKVHPADKVEQVYGNQFHRTDCRECGANLEIAPHAFTTVRDGYKNVTTCSGCAYKSTSALSPAQMAADSIKGYMKSMSVRRYAVAIDADETVVITNNTSKTRIFKDLGDSAAYNFLADVKYSFAAAEGYEITAVYVDGVEVKDPANVKIFQIRDNHVIKVVTEAVEAEAEDIVK